MISRRIPIGQCNTSYNDSMVIDCPIPGRFSLFCWPIWIAVSAPSHETAIFVWLIRPDATRLWPAETRRNNMRVDNKKSPSIWMACFATHCRRRMVSNFRPYRSEERTQRIGRTDHPTIRRAQSQQPRYNGCNVLTTILSHTQHRTLSNKLQWILKILKKWSRNHHHR